jgi:hypothetical protein
LCVTLSISLQRAVLLLSGELFDDGRGIGLREGCGHGGGQRRFRGGRRRFGLSGEHGSTGCQTERDGDETGAEHQENLCGPVEQGHLKIS